MVVVGGGFYGCSVASHFAESGRSVLLLEREKDFFQRASFHNQARIHQGYHYPRHFLTALRSRVNFSRFTKDYADCVVDSFEKYYAIASHFSKTNMTQFKNFMDRVGAPLEGAPDTVQKLFNPQRIEGVFKAQEYAFDALKLKEMTMKRMSAAGVVTLCGCEVTKVEGQPLRVSWRSANEEKTVGALKVYNCAYSGINDVLQRSGIAPLDFKHELTEMCLIKPPPELEGKGVTVMCGPFFSTMPFPTRPGLYTFSHVRYTPHGEWTDTHAKSGSNYDILDREKTSHFQSMMKDASQYLPCMAKAEYVDSLWEVKTILKQKEEDDGRPILFKNIDELPGLVCLMGGKIDNIYDVNAILE